MKTLIIEDNLATAKFYKAFLNKEAIDCDIILSGEKAIETIESINNNQYKLILLDLELPDVSGLKILQVIRKNFTSEELPVLVVSGIENENVITEVFENGANEFITKPFKNDDFKQKIQQFLGIQTMENETTNQ